MQKNIVTSSRADIRSVMEQEQQRGGVAYHHAPMHLHDEKPEGDFFELPHRWVSPPKEKR